MARPKKKRRICYKPEIEFFKPRGVPMTALEEIALEHDELEALRLKHIEKFTQKKAAKAMRISQSTFHRILSKAHQKISEAIINGKALAIDV